MFSRRQQEIRSWTRTSLSQAQGSIEDPAQTKDHVQFDDSPVGRLYSHCIILHSVPHCQKLLCISITVLTIPRKSEMLKWEERWKNYV